MSAGVPPRHQADPRADLDAGQAGLGHGRHVGQRGNAPGGGDGKRAQLALLDQRQQRIDRADEHVEASGQQIGDRGGGAAERHVDHVDTGADLEQFAADMLRRTDADRAEAQLLRRVLRQCDELLHGLGGQGPHRDRRLPAAHAELPRWRRDQGGAVAGAGVSGSQGPGVVDRSALDRVIAARRLHHRADGERARRQRDPHPQARRGQRDGRRAVHRLRRLRRGLSQQLRRRCSPRRRSPTWACCPRASPSATSRGLRGWCARWTLEGFGHCTLFGECQEACPKEISIDTITRMNRDFLRASLTARPIGGSRIGLTRVAAVLLWLHAGGGRDAPPWHSGHHECTSLDTPPPPLTHADPVPGRRRVGRVSHRPADAHVPGRWARAVSVCWPPSTSKAVTLEGGELTPGAWGEGFVDRRHPHTYVHELLADRGGRAPGGGWRRRRLPQRGQGLCTVRDR